MPNPLFPFNEYIPDGEPHVFGDRVYLYGSHDKEDGERFCMLDYVVYSASIYDLSKWKNHGVSYKKSEDPRSTKDKSVDYYAPDCVKGKDGRYYLYYVAMGPNTVNFGPMSVAVSDYPYGPFEYLHDLVNKDGTPLLKYLTNDPCVINDNGHIYLYYGWGLGRDFRNKLLSPLYNFVQFRLFKRKMKEIKETEPSILSCAFIELEDNMFTVKRGPIPVLDSKTTAPKNSELYHHAFYEAPSIRKINDTYYLIYSSGENSELAYATSKYPDKDFVYQGVIISNTDKGYKGNKTDKAYGGTIHGSIEKINGKWYIFYHRLTRNSNFSRLACAEEIKINEDGSISQTEMTSSGIDKKYLIAKGKYSSWYACNIYNEKRKTKAHEPMYSKDAEGNYVIDNITNNFIIGYKYFNFIRDTDFSILIKGDKGILEISDGDSKVCISIKENKKYTKYITHLSFRGIKPIYIKYKGKGKITLLEIEFKEEQK